MNKILLGFILFIGVLSISTSAIFVKLSVAPAPIIATYRLFFTVLLMTPLMLLSYRNKMKDIKKEDWIYASIAGFFLALHFILWFESLNYTSVASSVVLVTLQPLFAFVGTYLFFKEKFTWLMGSCVVAICGSAVTGWGDFQISGIALFGDALALLGAIMITIYFLFGQEVRKRLSLMIYTYMVYSSSTVILLLYVMLFSYDLIGYPTSDWLYFMLLALFPTLLGHSLFNWALKWVSTSTISMVILMEPIGASLLAYAILNETITNIQLLGGSIVMIGLFFFLYIKNRKGSKH